MSLDRPTRRLAETFWIEFRAFDLPEGSIEREGLLRTRTAFVDSDGEVVTAYGLVFDLTLQRTYLREVIEFLADSASSNEELAYIGATVMEDAITHHGDAAHVEFEAANLSAMVKIEIMKGCDISKRIDRHQSPTYEHEKRP